MCPKLFWTHPSCFWHGQSKDKLIYFDWLLHKKWVKSIQTAYGRLLYFFNINFPHFAWALLIYTRKNKFLLQLDFFQIRTRKTSSLLPSAHYIFFLESTRKMVTKALLWLNRVNKTNNKERSSHYQLHPMRKSVSIFFICLK